MAGGSPDACAEAFASSAARRKDLENRRGLIAMRLRPQGAGRPSPRNWNDEALRSVTKILDSPVISTAGKRCLIGQVVEKVVPRKDGADVIFVPTTFDEFETLQSIKV